MEIRIVDEDIRLIPYYKNNEVAIRWYQDKDVCKQVDDIDFVYDLDRLNKMYDYLFSHGEVYYIEFRSALVGDVSLKDDGEIAIVISKENQNQGIGRRVIKNILDLAKAKGMGEVRASIYTFNKQSQRVFTLVGFEKIGEEDYIYKFD